MNKCNFKRFIYIFVTLFVILCPVNTYAKSKLNTCSYASSDGGTKYEFDIYDDYSIARGNITYYKGKAVTNGEKVLNFDKAKAKQQKTNEVCPNYVLVFYNVNWGIIPNNYRVYAFYNKADMTDKAESLTPGKNGHEVVELTSINNSAYATVNADQIKTDADNLSGGLVMSGDLATSCDEVLGSSVVEFLQKIFNYIKILGPILVILLGSIDFLRSILENDDENMKKVQKKFGIRLICAVCLFFLPLIANLILNLVFGTSGDQVCGIK